MHRHCQCTQCLYQILIFPVPYVIHVLTSINFKALNTYTHYCVHNLLLPFNYELWKCVNNCQYLGVGFHALVHYHFEGIEATPILGWNLGGTEYGIVLFWISVMCWVIIFLLIT